MPPVALGELVVGLVFAVGVEVEDALDKVQAEHLRVLLQQQVEEAVLTQTVTASRRLCVSALCVCASSSVHTRVTHYVIYLAMTGTGSTSATMKRKKREPFHFTNSS